MSCFFFFHALLSSLPSARVFAKLTEVALGGQYQVGDTEYSIYWADLTELPVAISDATASTVANTIYIIGGCDSAKGNEEVPGSDYKVCTDISEKVMKYDVTGNSWTMGQAMSRPRFRHAAATVGTHIYIIGGRDVEDNILKTVMKYSTETDSWNTVQSLFEHATSDSAAYAYGDRVYTCGGWTQSYDSASDKCFVLDTSSATPQFTALEQKLNMGRGDFSIAVLDGFAYAYGGFSSSFAALDSMEKLNLKDPDRWTTASATMMHPRGDFAAAAFKGRVLAIGGENGTDDLSAGESLQHVEAYSPSDNAWLKSENNVRIPHATFRFCGATVGNSVYIFGGQRAYDATCNCHPTTKNVFSYTEDTRGINDAKDTEASKTQTPEASDTKGIITVLPIVIAFSSFTIS